MKGNKKYQLSIRREKKSTRSGNSLRSQAVHGYFFHAISHKHDSFELSAHTESLPGDTLKTHKTVCFSGILAATFKLSW